MTNTYNRMHKKSCVNCHFLQKNSTVIEERLQPDTDWDQEDRENLSPGLAERFPSCFMGEWNPFLEGKRYSGEELIEKTALTDRSNCRYFEPWQPGVSKSSVKRSRQEKLEASKTRRILRRSNYSILLACTIIFLSILKELWLGRLLFHRLNALLCRVEFVHKLVDSCS